MRRELARITVNQDHIDAVVTATDYVFEQHMLHGGELLAEQRVPIGHITGEDGAEGTTDVQILAPTTLFTKDFKFGRKKVFAYEVVTPEHVDFITQAKVPEKIRPNLQLAMYALGALEKYGLFYRWTHVSMTIIQPFLGHISEYTCSVVELLEVGKFLSLKAEETRTNPKFAPSPDACHFCRAAGNCEAQTRMVADIALDGFDEVPKAKKPVFSLGTMYSLIPFVEDWCVAIAKRVRDNLTQGQTVIRDDGLTYKLVEGKMGGREWSDEEKAEKLMLGMRLPTTAIYEQKLTSPAKLEKLAKVKKAKKGEVAPPPVVAPAHWERLQALIRQDDGKPAIALETDPRPAISTTDGFDEVGSDADLNSDLF